MLHQKQGGCSSDLFGSVALHWSAKDLSIRPVWIIAEKPVSPFVQQYKPIFTAENVDFPGEDLLAKHPLVSVLNIKWENGITQKLEALERLQLFFENGKIVALLCTVNETIGHSYNVQILLK